MYQLNDTIVAVSSPTSDNRVILRLTGPAAISILHQLFSTLITKQKSAIIPADIIIDPDLTVNAKLYLFSAPNSYTGEALAEIHMYTNSSVTQALIAKLLANGLRIAGPGEFTARAYLNGKIDLAQAEAVCEIVTGSNKFQLAAAEKLLAGRLTETTAQIRDRLMDCLSLIEAGLDFSGEDIEFITRDETIEKLDCIKQNLQQLLSGSISFESVIDLPAVGIAGATNAGKSSLLNRLLGQPRSIVSDQLRTTRDVLTGLLTLKNCRIVLFDCAGLIQTPDSILDELTQTAAVESLRKASVVILCVDISKTNWTEDIAIRKLIEPEVLIAVATKSDLLSEDALADRLARLNKLFGAGFLAVSAKVGTGIELLQNKIEEKIIGLAFRSTNRGTTDQVRDAEHAVALTVRHRQAVTEAIDNISQAVTELKAGNEEVTAMMLRASYQQLSNIEYEHVDEQVLQRIFSRFCIGK